MSSHTENEEGQREYDLVSSYGIEKIIWSENGSDRELRVTHRNGKVPGDLAALHDLGELPEGIEKVIEEMNYNKSKVNAGRTRLRREGIMDGNELVDVPRSMLEKIQDRYHVEDGNLVMDYGSEKPGWNEVTVSNYAMDEVLDYLSTEEKTDFWDLTRKICNDVYSDKSITQSVERAGFILDQLETDAYENVEASKQEGYKLLE